MNSQEEKTWQALSEELTRAVKRLNNSPLAEEKINSVLNGDNKCGYDQEIGYYEYTRPEYWSNWELIFNEPDYEKAKYYFAKKILSAIGYAVAMAGDEEQNSHWHYNTEQYDPTTKQWGENPPGWEYDLRYDRRKYWFEYTIEALSQLYSGELLNEYLQDCSKSMNYWFEDEHWQYDSEKKQFVEKSHSPELQSQK